MQAEIFQEKTWGSEACSTWALVVKSMGLGTRQSWVGVPAPLCDLTFLSLHFLGYKMRVGMIFSVTRQWLSGINQLNLQPLSPPFQVGLKVPTL